jgi:ribosomal protein L22
MSPKDSPARDDGPKADEEKAKVEAEAADSKAAEAQEEAAEEAEATAEPEPKEKPKRRRRASETSTAGGKSTRRDPDETVHVRARARYVRTAPRKARLVMDHIRGKDVEQARAILAYAPRAAATDVLKLLDSAVANAEHNHELGPDELRVRRAYVDEGPTIKRYRPRALGRATPIHKRTSHMTIELTTEGK